MSFFVALIVAAALLFSLIVQGREADRQARESTLANLETRAREAQRRVRESWWRASALQTQEAWGEFYRSDQAAQATLSSWSSQARAWEDWDSLARVQEVFCFGRQG